MKYTKFKDIPPFTSSGSYQIDCSPEYLVEWIEKEQEEMGLELNPDFQRGHVWTEQQQIAFLEYFLRGGKSGTILYFNCPSWHHNVPDGAYNDYVCVDGLQRITAFQRFIRNEIPAFGSYYREYTDSMKLRYTMKVNVNDLKTKAEVLQWYIEMNAGGTPHTDEEIERVKEMLAKDINTTLRKFVVNEEIPFEARLNQSPYTIEERVSEVAATMSLEGMNLSDEEKDTLRLHLSGKVSGDELRQKIMEKAQREL